MTMKKFENLSKQIMIIMRRSIEVEIKKTLLIVTELLTGSP